MRCFYISIHVLREEDDPITIKNKRTQLKFQSTSSARRTTDGREIRAEAAPISIHVLREEDDLIISAPTRTCCNFNPRPPRGGRRRPSTCIKAVLDISIHVLREEDDLSGGKLAAPTRVFQSTSSARRTTRGRARRAQNGGHFNPRPPRGGRQIAERIAEFLFQFQSTSSARRTTTDILNNAPGELISIHVLREEDDFFVDDYQFQRV